MLRFSDVDEKKLHPELRHQLKKFKVYRFLLAAAVILPLVYLRPWNLLIYPVVGIFSYIRYKRLLPELEEKLKPYRNTRATPVPLNRL